MAISGGTDRVGSAFRCATILASTGAFGGDGLAILVVSSQIWHAVTVIQTRQFTGTETTATLAFCHLARTLILCLGDYRVVPWLWPWP